MKKTKNTILAFVAGALCLTGCESGDQIEVSNAHLVSLTVYQEGEEVTKAAIDGSTSTQINWSANDKINYFGGAVDESMTLKEEDAGKSSGIFEGTVTTGTQDYVLYPYQATATCTAGQIIAEVPMTQFAVTDSFDPAAALMVGEVQGTSVEFKNVMSYVKVTVPSDMTNCKQVVLKAKDAWTTVAGKVNITASTGAWAETVAKEGQAFVRLVPKAGETYLAAGASYYIAILPQIMTTGFELIFNDNDFIKVKQSVSSSVEFARSKTKKLAAITDFTYIVSVINLTSTLNVADRNIGAATTGYADCGDYFAWGALRPAYTTISESTLTLYKEGGFIMANAPYFDGSAYTKYTSSDGKTTLEPEDDIAAMLWGGKWRMPKRAELESLNSLEKKWISGGPYFNFTGDSDHSSSIVSLPAAGSGSDGDIYNQTEFGNYGSASLYNDNNACIMHFYIRCKNVVDYGFRYSGYSVRAVLAE